MRLPLPAGHFLFRKKASDLRIYLDACCLNRLTDDQSQARVRNEADAVEGILGLVRAGRVTWPAGTPLEIEIGRNPDAGRRRDTASLLAFANEFVVPGPPEAGRAAFLQKLGFGSFDALHLATAERGEADVFLTTDDDLLRRARKLANVLRVRVQNPVSWYRETSP